MQFLALVVALAATFHVAVANPTSASPRGELFKKLMKEKRFSNSAHSAHHKSLRTSYLYATVKTYDDVPPVEEDGEFTCNTIDTTENYEVGECYDIGTEDEPFNVVVDSCDSTAGLTIIIPASNDCDEVYLDDDEFVIELNTCDGQLGFSVFATCSNTEPVPSPAPSPAPSTAPVAAPTTAPVTAPSSDEKAACFAGSETVMLESGTTKLISDVNVGDRILAADMNGVTVFSSVVAHAHPKNNIAATFVHIETGSTDIKVTADHLLLASADCIKMQLMKASDIAIGSCLLTVDGAERVEAISTNVGNGIYSVITQEEMIVVNGVVASPFAVNHQAASRYYNIHRAMMTVFPAALGFKLFESLHFGVSAFIGSYV